MGDATSPQTLKETRSFDPVTWDIVPARIVEIDERIYMVKGRPPKKALLEKDPGLYKLLMPARRPDRPFAYRGFAVRITLRCNSKCKHCFTRSPLPSDEISVQDIAKFAATRQRELFVLSGGEPTLRDDLPLIIQTIIKSRNIPILITNGIKLADFDYVAVLRKAGLNSLCLSFNGFNDAVYERINGRPYLATKLEALDNIKKAGLKINLGYLVVKGVNDQEADFNEVFDFFLKNKGFIREITLRAAAPLGRQKSVKTVFLSDLVHTLSQTSITSRLDIMNEIKFLKYLDIYFHTHILMPCRIDLFFKVRKNRFFPIIRENDWARIEASRFKRTLLLFYSLKFFGPFTFGRLLMRKARILNYQKLFFWSRNILRVSLRLWPNKDTIDLGDLNNCQDAVIRNGRPVPRCYSTIREDLPPEPTA